VIPRPAVDRVTVAAASSSGESDEQLIRRYVRGDRHAFGHLLARYRQRIVTLVRYRLGSRSLWVEDVAQDVFLQVHRKARSFEGRSAFKTWLFGVALNVCRDHLRRERRAIHTSATGAEDDAVLAALPCESLDPLEMLERIERDALIRGAIERLTPANRIVLQLRDWEEMSYDQISVVLAVPVGTVRSRLHNARAKLAQELAMGMKRS
jgi:RNA polymerase sigma-70 factor (ECF subfamily)